ncbi:hypothetical protein M413DRAFT_318528 [Hebeloma cylindrosporum]|uniref:Uncharacterized protein n=1 Tax=Hebeloma cylindrosporum TaxID=76867 RepID=A0A0C3CRP2_HEBCY|nr:hypothetical protein M413DRAFT_318528 [Hebeloma cylindrosporum h7]
MKETPHTVFPWKHYRYRTFSSVYSHGALCFSNRGKLAERHLGSSKVSTTNHNICPHPVVQYVYP